MLLNVKIVKALNLCYCRGFQCNYFCLQGKEKKTLAEIQVELKTYPCKRCGESFFKAKYLNEHFREAHGRKPVSCPECNVVFPGKTMLDEHIRCLHPKQRLQCNECYRTFVSKPSLLLHQISHSDNTPVFVEVRGRLIRENHDCDICGKFFKTKHLLARHHIVAHLFPKGIKCELCERVFKSKSQQQRHLIASHSEDPYVCELCGKHFVKEIFYKRHRKREHRRHQE